MLLPERRVRFTLSYDGTGYHGWQVQPRLPTIQGELERVLSEIEKRPVTVHGSGRTDAGVHALAQVAASTMSNPIPCDNLRRAVNRLLPSAIRIHEAAEAPSTFHPRFDAIGKEYEYRIWREEVRSPFLRHFTHHHPYPLDEEAMMEAATLFVGDHDFNAFAASDLTDIQGASRVRRIFSSVLTREGNLLRFRIHGSGFLKHMVRNLMGALMECGKGNLSHADLSRLLQGTGRPGAMATVPGCGLFLVRVHYEGWTSEGAVITP